MRADGGITEYFRLLQVSNQRGLEIAAAQRELGQQQRIDGGFGNRLFGHRRGRRPGFGAGGGGRAVASGEIAGTGAACYQRAAQQRQAEAVQTAARTPSPVMAADGAEN